MTDEFNLRLDVYRALLAGRGEGDMETVSRRQPLDLEVEARRLRRLLGIRFRFLLFILALRDDRHAVDHHRERAEHRHQKLLLPSHNFLPYRYRLIPVLS